MRCVSRPGPVVTIASNVGMPSISISAVLSNASGKTLAYVPPRRPSICDTCTFCQTKPVPLYMRASPAVAPAMLILFSVIELFASFAAVRTIRNVLGHESVAYAGDRLVRRHQLKSAEASRAEPNAQRDIRKLEHSAGNGRHLERRIA